jgi:VWFA-related protein
MFRGPIFTLSFTSLMMALFAGAFPLSVSAQDPNTFGEKIDVSAVELMIDVRDKQGKIPDDLKPEDFIVLEDGKPQRVIGLERLTLAPAATTSVAGGPRVPPTRPTWQTLVYFDHGLSSRYSIIDAAKKLSEMADQLAALGTVEVVEVRPRISVTLEPTRDPAAIRAAMAKVLQHPLTLNEIDMVRQQNVTAVNTTAGGRAAASDFAASSARFASKQELYVLRRHREQLVGFLGRYDDRSPKVLFFVNDGFDLSPISFYAAQMRESLGTSGLLGEHGDFSESKDYDAFLQDIAGRHWTIFPLATGYMGKAMGDITSAGSFQGFQLNEMLSASEVLRRAAQLTGGEVLLSPKKIEAAVTDLSQRYRLTYQFDHPADNKLHKVEVKAVRAGLNVAAPQRTRFASAKDLAEARARSLLLAPYERGELSVRCAVNAFKSEGRGKQSTNLTVVADATSLGEFRSRLNDTQLRYSVAVSSSDPGDLPFVTQQVEKGIDFAARKGFVFEIPLRFKPNANKVAVVVEEMTSGAWGSCVGPLKPEAVAVK